MDWYYKAALIVGLIWATARVLGAYGEAARELDINFLYGFLLTMGGWGMVFLIIDRVAKALGWRRQVTDAGPGAPGTVGPGTVGPGTAEAGAAAPTPAPPPASPTPRTPGARRRGSRR